MTLADALTQVMRLIQSRQLPEAEHAARQILAQAPGHPYAVHLLGVVADAAGNSEAGIDLIQQAIAADPGVAGFHHNLGLALEHAGRYAAAARSFGEALGLRFQVAEFHFNLGRVLMTQGRVAEALESFHRALKLAPDHLRAGSSLVAGLNYSDLCSLGDLYQAHRLWNQQFAAHLAPPLVAYPHERDSERTLRIGYVSADLRNHPVGCFMEPILRERDVERFHVTCYASVAKPDSQTRHLREFVDRWCDVGQETDEELAHRIRNDRIDVLVDLSGHTAGHRLLAMARRPAPVQLAWLGYFGTTGLDAIEFLISDPHHARMDEAEFFSEKLVMLPETRLCYRPPAAAPRETRRAKEESSATFSFGSFSILAKLNSNVIRVWARILTSVPRSRLVLKCKALSDAETAERLVREFSSLGVDPRRIVCEGSSPFTEYLAGYQHIDIVLDPFPFSGSTTACDALWNAVPVVTLDADRFAGRQTASHLRNLQLDELVARNTDDYERIALELANDSDRLAVLREDLRDRMRRSPLCDAPRFTRHLEEVYRRLWQGWCVAQK